jgi:hypothetical protein
LNLFEIAYAHLREYNMEHKDADAMLLWWGSVGIGRLWSWEDEVSGLTARQVEQLNVAAVAWISRGKPEVAVEH